MGAKVRCVHKIQWSYTDVIVWISEGSEAWGDVDQAGHKREWFHFVIALFFVNPIPALGECNWVMKRKI